MNLSKLFEAQAILDKRIVEEKGLEGQDLLDKKILALQVELGELAQNWRGFKFWVDNQNPNVDASCDLCDGKGEKTVTISDFHPSYGYATHYELAICPKCKGNPIYKNPLLEEYVDCLHFIISIGNDLEIEQWDYDYTFKDDLMELDNITEQFIMIMGGARQLFYDIAYRNGMKDDEKVSEFELEFRVWKSYRFIIGPFLSLGKMLGFTWKQIEQAYYEKNKINHERQESGY